MTRTQGEPAAIVPVRAADVLDLRGKRAIVGEPGKGWRYDMRTDRPSDDTHIPVLAELSYYRAEIERVEVLAVLVPIDRVWIEQVADAAIWPGAGDAAKGPVSLASPPLRRPRPAGHPLPPHPPAGSHPLPAEPPQAHPQPAGHRQRSGHTRGAGDRDPCAETPALGGPPEATSALPRLTGQRVVVVSRGETVRELRAMTEAYRDARGNTVVNVCPERDWYAWAINGTTPAPTAYPVNLVWIE